MIAETFERQVCSVTQDRSRRGLLRLGHFAVVASALAALGLRADDDAEARKKKKKRKKNQPGSPPPPVGQVDAFCPAPGNNTLSTLAPNRMAQTFTANTRGWLVSAEIVLEGETGTEGDYIMGVATTDDSGVPTGNVLATTTIASSQFSDGLSTVTFTFPDPATVLPGRRYALVLTRSAPNNLRWRAHDYDACSTGAAFISTDGVFYGGLISPFDHVFATFVKP